MNSAAPIAISGTAAVTIPVTGFFAGVIVNRLLGLSLELSLSVLSALSEGAELSVLFVLSKASELSEILSSGTELSEELSEVIVLVVLPTLFGIVTVGVLSGMPGLLFWIGSPFSESFSLEMTYGLKLLALNATQPPLIEELTKL